MVAASGGGGGSLEGASLDVSTEGCGGTPLSKSPMTILKPPSTITTTLAATSKERIFATMVEGCLLPLFMDLSATFDGVPLSPTGWAAAAWAARRAAAIKLAVETGGRGVAGAGISLIAFSEAAIRSDGEATWPLGRVPGSSG